MDALLFFSGVDSCVPLLFSLFEMVINGYNVAWNVDRIVGSVMVMERDRQAQCLYAACGGLRKRRRKRARRYQTLHFTMTIEMVKSVVHYLSGPPFNVTMLW